MEPDLLQILMFELGLGRLRNKVRNGGTVAQIFARAGIVCDTSGIFYLNRRSI